MVFFDPKCCIIHNSSYLCPRKCPHRCTTISNKVSNRMTQAQYMNMMMMAMRMQFVATSPVYVLH